MLSSAPLSDLSRRLTSIIASLSLPSQTIGHPEIVRKAAEESATIFQGYAKAKPSKQDAYAAALAYMRGESLDDRQTHLVAGALCESIREQGGRRLVGHARLEELLRVYEREAAAQDLWRLTWFGLLGSYFAFDIDKATETEKAGWERLRKCLKQTWSAIDAQTGAIAVPDWVKVVRDDVGLLGPDPARKYALDYLDGEHEAINKLARDLGISESSWFWQTLVLGAVKRSADFGDARFKAVIPDLLRLIEQRPVFRDEAIELILTRYHRSTQELHAQLRDYVVAPEVWRNPKLREAGLATKWTRVGNPVWQMALQWVNEANLKDFFEILAAQDNADEGRLQFWSQYMNQITWTRLIFSAKTRRLAQRNAAVRTLIAREEGSYATMSANMDVDAFMMQLGDYIVVEFSKVPNSAYIYKADELPYEPYEREYRGNTEDLKAGYHGEHARAARITHQPGWEYSAASELRRLRIHPDDDARATTRRTSTTQRGKRTGDDRRTRANAPAGLARAPDGAVFTMSQLRELTSKFANARINDLRQNSKGRLWVECSGAPARLDLELRRLGFKWAASRSAWYFPEQGS